jgi:hypothetical protein
VALAQDLIIEAVIREGRPEYSFRELLDAAWYNFRMAYYERDKMWRLDVLEDTGAAIVRGIAMVEGRDYLAPFQAYDVPPGQLFAVDTSGLGRTPDRYAWQQWARLYYRSRSVTFGGQVVDVVALAAGTAAEVF